MGRIINHNFEALIGRRHLGFCVLIHTKLQNHGSMTMSFPTNFIPPNSLIESQTINNHEPKTINNHGKV